VSNLNANTTNEASQQGDQMSLLKIAQNMAQHIFVIRNKQLLPRKKVALKFGLLLNFPKKNHPKKTFDQ
jgi:hypothetical protein